MVPVCAPSVQVEYRYNTSFQGLISKQLGLYCKRIVGVDISQGMVDEYNKHVHNQGISPDEMVAICTDLKGDSGELDGQKFDVIVVSFLDFINLRVQLSFLVRSFISPFPLDRKNNRDTSPLSETWRSSPCRRYPHHTERHRYIRRFTPHRSASSRVRRRYHASNVYLRRTSRFRDEDGHKGKETRTRCPILPRQGCEALILIDSDVHVT